MVDQVANGIGSGDQSQNDNISAGDFSTGANGNAIIYATGGTGRTLNATGIGDTSSQESWQGIIFDNNDGKVYGTMNLPDDLAPLDQNLTREQLATMRWRYAGSPEASSDLTGFADAAAVNDYAQQAMNWAVENGLISGMDDGTLAPQGPATPCTGGDYPHALL